MLQVKYLLGMHTSLRSMVSHFRYQFSFIAVLDKKFSWHRQITCLQMQRDGNAIWYMYCV